MTATNHALAGAIVGLTIANPVLAVPLAFASHFMLDAIPHFDPPGNENERISAGKFRYQLLADAAGCMLLVAALILSKPHHWLLAAICAFIATSPDLFWLPKFVHAQRTGSSLPDSNIFWKFHTWIQWKTGPDLWWTEALAFLLLCGSLAFSL